MARVKETFPLPEIPKGHVWVLAQCSVCGAHEWWRSRWYKRTPHAPGLQRTCWTCNEGVWQLRPVLPLNDRGEQD